MGRTNEGLAGRGFRQSPGEWEIRNSVLGESLSQLVGKYLMVTPGDGHGLDVGCQGGLLADHLREKTLMIWEGVDPIVKEPKLSPGGTRLRPGSAHDLPYPDASFDCLILANVLEHIVPGQRQASFVEMYRVMRPGAIVVGQLPNPYFPIESHSRLPFMGWLPYRFQKKYWRLSPVPWEHDFFVVTLRQLRREAEGAGFQVVQTNNFNYPAAALPRAARPIATVLKWPMRRFPWAWQFVLRRPYPAG